MSEQKVKAVGSKGTLKIFGLIAALIILVIAVLMPGSETLSHEGIVTIGILLATLVLLLTNALPIAISCLFALAMLMLLGARTPREAFSGFTNQIVYFIIASFGLSLAISSTNLSKRLLVRLMGIFGKSVDYVLLAVMICTAVLSSVISNVAAAVIFMTVSMDFLSVYDNEEDKKRTGRAFMISLPIASMIGGMATPAGSSLNVLTLSYMEDITGTTVSFVQWMLCAIPVVILAVPLAWVVIRKVNKLAPISKESFESYVDRIRIREKFSGKEIYVGILIIIMVTCWILGSWFPYMCFNLTVVAVCGLVLMFVPGTFSPKLTIMKWEDLAKEVSWSAIILVGSMICLGDALGATGASAWIVSVIIPTSLSLPAILITFLVAILIFVMLIFIPVAPALIPVLAAPLAGLAGVAGLSPLLLLLTLSMVSCNCYLLPFDTVPLITYMTGYYKIKELAKTAVWIQVALAVIIALWLPIATGLLGI